jgi:hypothetical protein
VNKIGSSRFFDLPKMLKEVLSRLSPQEPKYKVYTALLTQSGTDAPVATVLENTLGGDVVWSYEDVGNYYGTLNTITPEKTTITVGTSTSSFLQNPVLILTGVSSGYVEIGVGEIDLAGSAFNPKDEDFNSNLVEIRIYE